MLTTALFASSCAFYVCVPVQALSQTCKGGGSTRPPGGPSLIQLRRVGAL